MVVEALNNHPEVIPNFIDQFLEESQIHSKGVKEALYFYLANSDINHLVDKMIEGVRTNEIDLSHRTSLIDMLENEYPFYTDPMPNILFQRDPFASIGGGVVINNMFTDARQRETIFSEYMFRYHPRFENESIECYIGRTPPLYE